MNQDDIEQIQRVNWWKGFIWGVIFTLMLSGVFEVVFALLALR